MLDEERVRNTNQILEDSMNTRREAELNLTMCCGKGDLAPLEKDVKGLSVVDLNKQVCVKKMEKWAELKYETPSCSLYLNWLYLVDFIIKG